jgi:hypothetical protein
VSHACAWWQVTRDRLLRDFAAEEQGISFGTAFGSGYPGGASSQRVLPQQQPCSGGSLWTTGMIGALGSREGRVGAAMPE